MWNVIRNVYSDMTVSLYFIMDVYQIQFLYINLHNKGATEEQYFIYSSLTLSLQAYMKVVLVITL